ncbi:MAG: M13 family metallopeptidase [Sphingomonas sp.]|uniref:M13 family metallopeptidase n=1 Tax=Sphingomonas sp. TaxID=28214 RepID=UPI003F7F0122
MKTFAIIAALATATVLGGAIAAGPIYPPHGLDLSARDDSVRPGDDFFNYSNGKYLRTLTIPSDQVSAGKRFDMSKRIEERLHAIMDDVSANATEAPVDVKGKVGAYYASFMDEKTIETLGAKPLAPELDAIRGAQDRSALAALAGEPGFYASPFGAYIDTDLKQPGVYAVYMGQGGLLLPDRDYYLTKDFEKQRAAYRAYIQKMLTLIGWEQPDASADAVMAFETRIAEASWTKVQQRDLTTQYNPMTPAELAAYAPGFDWPRYLKAAKLGTKKRLVVTNNTAFPKVAKLWADTPVATLKAWEAFRVADLAAPYLSSPFVDTGFDFHGKTLSGLDALPPRWKRGIGIVGGGDCGADPASCFGSIGWAVGELYSQRYFPAETKAKITDLVGHLKTAFHHRIEKIDWMGPATRAEALKKLETYQIKVGYPDKPRDYSSLAIKRDDLLGNARRAVAYEYDFQVGRSDGPVDRADWLMTPQTNDAYNGSLRDIVFPAGILQAPMFDAAADPAYNYGAIGGVIGHEMTHGFDDQGRSIDSTGALRDWWTAADAAAFKKRAAMLGAQYAKYEPVPGMFINPDLTMGENIADLGGLSIALQAYHESLRGKPAPVVDGLTGDQRVFMGWAQVWAGKMKEEAIRRQVASDPHSFRKVRVNGVVRNIDGWYAAFGVKPGEALYVAPKDRVRIW